MLRKMMHLVQSVGRFAKAVFEVEYGFRIR